MTLADLRNLLRAHLEADLDNFAGNTPGGVSDAELTKQLNYGLRAVGRAIFMVRVAELEVVAHQVFYPLDELSPKMVRVIQVARDDAPFKDYFGRPGVMTFAHMRADCLGWETGIAVGVPQRAIQTGVLLALYPNPSANETLTVLGQALPAPMVEADDVPDVPEWLHEAIVLVAARYAADPDATEQEALARLERYDNRAFAAVQEEAARNMAMWGLTPPVAAQ